MSAVPVLDTGTLVEANRQAVQSHMNKVLTTNAIDTLDPDGKHVVFDNFLHDDGDCVRCRIMLKLEGRDEPVVGMLDMPLPFFNDLPRNYVG